MWGRENFPQGTVRCHQLPDQKLERSRPMSSDPPRHHPILSLPTEVPTVLCLTVVLILPKFAPLCKWNHTACLVFKVNLKET